MCILGTYLDGRNDKVCHQKCKNCEDEMYKPTYNTDLSCHSCENCRRSESFQRFPQTDCTKDICRSLFSRPLSITGFIITLLTAVLDEFKLHKRFNGFFC